MFRNRIAVVRVVLALLGSTALFSQPPTQPSLAPPGSTDLELPVTMRQNVTAGVTAVGTKVQAKLAVATLVRGTVIPQNAILSGEVTESVARTATAPSRLAIRMDLAQWKNGSIPIKTYLTAWFYPLAILTAQDAADGSPSARSAPMGRSGVPIYPDPNGPLSTPGSAGNDPFPPASDSSTSKHRVIMKNVEATRDAEGVVTLSSKRFNLKLDKQTTYVFATGTLLPMN